MLTAIFLIIKKFISMSICRFVRQKLILFEAVSRIAKRLRSGIRSQPHPIIIVLAIAKSNVCYVCWWPWHSKMKQRKNQKEAAFSRHFFHFTRLILFCRLAFIVIFNGNHLLRNGFWRDRNENETAAIREPTWSLFISHYYIRGWLHATDMRGLIASRRQYKIINKMTNSQVVCNAAIDKLCLMFIDEGKKWRLSRLSSRCSIARLVAQWTHTVTASCFASFFREKFREFLCSD